MNSKKLILYRNISTNKKQNNFLFGKWLINSYKNNYSFVIKSNTLNTSPIEDDKDIVYKQAIKLTNLLASGLNEVLSLQEKNMYWKTILYPWIYYYSNYIMSVSRRAETILKLKKSLKCDIINFDYYKYFVPNNINQFNELTGNELWNAPIIRNIFIFLEKKRSKKKIQFSYLKRKQKKLLKKNSHTIYNTFKDKILKLIINFFNMLPTRSNQPFIISPYLSNLNEVLLKISYFSFPKVFKSPKIIYKSPNFAIRENLVNILLKNKKLSKYDIIAISCLKNCLPVSYLECHKKIVKQTEKINWPIKPKFIFTSNNHIWDEFFKTWTAKKRSLGTPFFIGQHGANFATNKSSVNYSEEIIPDKLFTWGWKIRKKFHIPSFNFKI